MKIMKAMEVYLVGEKSVGGEGKEGRRKRSRTERVGRKEKRLQLHGGVGLGGELVPVSCIA